MNSQYEVPRHFSLALSWAGPSRTLECQSSVSNILISSRSGKSQRWIVTKDIILYMLVGNEFWILVFWEWTRAAYLCLQGYPFLFSGYESLVRYTYQGLFYDTNNNTWNIQVVYIVQHAKQRLCIAAIHHQHKNSPYSGGLYCYEHCLHVRSLWQLAS